MEYLIHEGNMERIQKKLKRIENKCRKYGNTNFKFEIKGETFKEFINKDTEVKYSIKYFIVEAEGIAKINDWVFVGTIEHTNKGNIIRQFKTDVDVPEKYRYSNSICEHCNTKRARKDTYLVYNEVTKEFKQVGKSCLQDFTNGLSAENIAQYISWFDEIIQGEEVVGNGYIQYYPVEIVLLNAIETIKHYGFVSKAMAQENNGYIATVDRVIDFMFPYSMLNSKDILQEMERIQYNPERDDNKIELSKILDWINTVNTDNQYISNLKIAVSNDYCTFRNFGLLVSLPSAYFRAFEREQNKILREQKRAERAKQRACQRYIGNIGERLNIDIKQVECVTSFQTDYGTMRIYRFETVDDNILIWKTSNFIENAESVKKIKATIKKHSEYKDELQTEINRIKIIG